MIEPGYLIAFFSFTVFYFIFKMIKNRDDLHAFSFFTLFVYTIFAQIGYAYFPEASILLGAYFGPDLFYQYWLFIFLSFLLTYTVYRLFYNRAFGFNWISLKPYGGYRKYIFYTSALVLFALLLLYFIINRNEFAWGTANPMGSQWFAVGYRIYSIYCVIFYALWRTTVQLKKRGIFPFLIFVPFVIFYITVATAAGTRSDILYLFISIAMYELHPIIDSIRTRKKHIAVFIICAIITINFLLLLSKVREQSTDISISSLTGNDTSQSNVSDAAPILKILMQDYFAPSHTLFVSMQYGVIDFLEVAKSSAANSLIFFKYPYLSQTVTSIVDFQSERGVGWAYYVFVEGYNAAGWFGIFYNAIFFNVSLALLLSLTKTNNHTHNKVMFAAIFLFIVTCIRSQYSDFIKTFWMMLIPGFFITAFAFGSRVTFRGKLIQTNKIN